MRATALIVVIGLMLASCANVSNPSQDHISSQPGRSADLKADWDTCAEQAVDKRWQECQTEGYSESGCFGAALRGMQMVSTEACGPEPAPAKLSDEHKEVLQNSCKTGHFDQIAAIASAHFMTYDPQSPLMQEARATCAGVRAEALVREAAEKLERASKIKIGIGSSEQDVYAKFGKPSDINTSVGRWGVHKQLVYGTGLYIYIQNGQVSSWQH